MKVLLTFALDGDESAQGQELTARVIGFVYAGRAERGAVNLRATGSEHDAIAMVDTERGVSALVELFEPRSVEDALTIGDEAGVRLVGAYAVHEVLQKDYERTWGPGEISPGIKLLCPVRRRPDLTHEQFSDHWRLNHGPLAVDIQPGFWHYVQNHVDERLTPATPAYDGIGFLHFREAGDIFTGMFSSAEAQRLIYEDIERFLDGPGSSMVLASKELLVGG
jgi:EthD domain